MQAIDVKMAKPRLSYRWWSCKPRENAVEIDCVLFERGTGKPALASRNGPRVVRIYAGSIA